jgi:septal ring-binding cell division protein DamX
MSTTHTPPPDAPIPPPAAPERRCPRCGSTLSPDQEWCLSCGAAADTEIVEARGWRVPIYLSTGLAALALLGIILVIVALSGGPKVSPTPTPSPAPTNAAPAPTATVSPVPTATVSPAPTGSPSTSATPSPTENPTETPSVSPSPTSTVSPTPTTSGSSSFPGWTGGDGWTIIIESATSQSKAEKVATSAQNKGQTVGILKSDDYSSLNPGYWVVFSGTYTSKKDALDNLSSVQKDFKDAYVRHVKQ